MDNIEFKEGDEVYSANNFFGSINGRKEKDNQIWYIVKGPSPTPFDDYLYNPNDDYSNKPKEKLYKVYMSKSVTATFFRLRDRVKHESYGLGFVIQMHDYTNREPIFVVFDNGETHTFEPFTNKLQIIPLSKKRENELSAVNPSYYCVKDIPEAIEIMRGLMTDEQLEGFLWGNILKYAYRYGRKGDKKETAGKIGWYAEHLAELWRKEKSKEKKS